MPKVARAAYYAVRVGRVPGIYHSWTDCETQVKGFVDAVYKKFNTDAEAIAFIAAKHSTAPNIVPAASSSRAIVTSPRSTHSTSKDPDDCDVVYCDGACKGNGQLGSVAGIGVWWGHGDPRNISERCPGDQTNNRAELIAIIRVLETAPHLRRRLLIKTDSNYSIQCVTAWIFKWLKNGFLAADGKPVKNRVLIKYLAALLHVRQKTSQIVGFQHVRGHVGIEGNEAADQLANFGATMPAAPERDWERLEEEVLQSLKPARPIRVVDDDLKAYADGLLSGDELAGLTSDTSGCNVALPEPRPRHSGSMTGSRVADQVNLMYTKSKEPSKSTSSRSTVRIAASSNEYSTASIGQEELEMYASCLLGDEELSSLGRDGVFDSDF